MYSKLDRSNTSKIQHGASTPGSSTRGNAYVRDGSATVYFKDGSTDTWFTPGGGGGGIGVFEEGTGSASAQRIDQSLNALGASSFLMGTSVSNDANSSHSFAFGYANTLSDAQFATVFGSGNTLNTDGFATFIAGRNTTISSQDCGAFGNNQIIYSGADGSFTAGEVNRIGENSSYSATFNRNNVIGTTSPYSFMVGRDNQIGNSSQVSFCAGYQNSIGNSSLYSFVGGISNTVSGTGNTVFGSSCTVTTSTYNLVAGQSLSLASGSNSNAIFGATATINGDYNLTAGYTQTNTGNYNFVSGRGNSIAGDYNAVTGYEQSLVSASSYNLITGYSHEITSSTHSVVSGNNSALSNSVGSAVFGGNNAVGASGTSNYNVVGGYDNTVGQSSYSAVFGATNVSSGAAVFYNLIGGRSNQVYGAYCFVVGQDNVVPSTTNNYSVMMGKRGLAVWRGATTFAGDHIDGSTNGNSQCMTNLPLVAQTVGAVSETMKFDLTDTASPLYLVDGYVQTYKVRVLASDSGTTGMELYDIDVMAWRNDPIIGGVTANTSVILQPGSLAINVTAAVDATNNCIEINVTGEAGKTINYVANIYAGCQCETGYVATC